MKKIIYTIIILAILISGAFYLYDSKKTDQTSYEPKKEDVSEISKYLYTEQYIDTDYRFGLKYPKDFSVITAANEDGTGKTVIVQNIIKKIGLQIIITPFTGGDIELTPELIKEEIPNLKIENPNVVNIDSLHKGLAFTSDNPDFGGSSSELWFVFKNNLYQISTYLNQESFLKGTFATLQW